MNQLVLSKPTASRRATNLFGEHQLALAKHTDHLFAWLMLIQFVAASIAAILLIARSWPADETAVHFHIATTVLVAAVLTGLPVVLAFSRRGQTETRHAIAVGQMLVSALLIHISGGRIETHFHIFASIALLAAYRDWRVLLTAGIVTAADHLTRGLLWPQSIYGLTNATVSRSIEHIAWVTFEILFLTTLINKTQSELRTITEHQASLETHSQSLERALAGRTAELAQQTDAQRHADEQLRKSQLQLARAQEIARIGTWEWDVSTDKVTWSEETRRLYDFDHAQAAVSMETWLQRVHPDDLAHVRDTLDYTIKTGQPYTCDHRILLPNGTERHMHSRGEVRLDDIGKVIHITGTTQDVTRTKRSEEALRRSEEQLRQSQKMEAVGRLAGGVAHDFNNLLTVITGYCALLTKKAHPDDPLRANAEQIQHAAERASSLTRQLLAFSRKQVLHPRTLDLSEIMHGMEKILHRMVGEDIELQTVCHPNAGKVEADPGQIEQVLLNMAVNAREAMPHGGKLTIRVSNVILDQKTVTRDRSLEPGQYVMIAVSDTGIGMTSEVRAHLFEPFFTTKGAAQRTGLGLATCYGIIAQSGGDIRVYSEPGAGTTFKIYLPRTDKHLSSIIPDLEADTMPAGTERILIVEDDEAVRTLAQTVLRDCGYKIAIANDGAEALAVLEKDSNFHLIITDVIMPRLGGRPLYDHVKKTLPDTKVLFISGYTDDALATRGVLDQGFHFLEKPFSPSALARQVRSILDNSEHDTMFRRLTTRIAT